MKLSDLVTQIQRAAGDASGEKFSMSTVLAYINEEVQAVVTEFPEKASFEWSTTGTGYYHTVDFTGAPVVKVTELLINGSPSEKKRWKDLKGRIATDAV